MQALALHPAALARQRSDLLQVEGRHRSFKVDVLYECWAVADRLSLHSVAGHCEWALAKMCGERSVYARASMLSPGAVHRIARSLCVGLDASRRGLWGAECARGTSSGPHDVVVELEKVSKVSKSLTVTATAAAMAHWRTGEAEETQGSAADCG